MDRPSDDLFQYLLRLGDSCLILGQRLGEWCGHAANLEIDIALTNTALDLVGQANALLGHAGALDAHGRDADRLAFTRDGYDFRNLLICERPNGDYAQTIARQFLFDAWQLPTLQALTDSADERLAAFAAKAVKEATYHLRHSGDWVVRLGDGTAESAARMQAALDGIWMYSGEMFTADAVHHRLQEAGIAPDQSVIQSAWNATIAQTLAEARLQRPADGWMQSGGGQGKHSEHLGHILSEMQFLQRAYPGAQW